MIESQEMITKECYSVREKMPVYDVLKNLTFASLKEWGEIPDGATVRLFVNNLALVNALNHQIEEEYSYYPGFKQAISRFSSFEAVWVNKQFSSRPNYILTNMDRRIRATYEQWHKNYVAKTTTIKPKPLAAQRIGRIGMSFGNLRKIVENDK